MFSAKHSVKSTLLCGPAELSKSFMFEAAIYWAEEGRRVVYITPAPLESLPAACHDRSNPAPAAFKLMRFIWVVSRDKKAAIWITEFNGLEYNQDPIIEEDGFAGGPINGALAAGDLNAKSTLWGSKKNNHRSDLSRFFSSMGLIPINTAGSYTFERNAGVSKTHIPAFDRVAFRLVDDGRVLQDYSASDQKYLLHVLYKRIINKSFCRQKKKREPVIWNIEGFDVTKFADEYERTVKPIPEHEEMNIKDINKFLKYVNTVCAKTMNRKGTALTWRPPNIWWNEEVSNLRKETIKKRRILLRARKKGKGSAQEMAELEGEFKRSRRRYRLSRIDSKIKVWKQIREELEYMRYVNLVNKYEEGDALAVIAHLFPISTEEQEEEQQMGGISMKEKENVQLTEDTNRNDEDIKISTEALRIPRYLEDYEALVERLVELHTFATLPSVLLIDDFDTYINEHEKTRATREAHIARTCSAILDTMNSCGRILKTSVHVCAWSTLAMNDITAYAMYFLNIWNVTDEEDGKTILLQKYSHEASTVQCPSYRYCKLQDGTRVLKQILYDSVEN